MGLKRSPQATNRPVRASALVHFLTALTLVAIVVCYVYRVGRYFRLTGPGGDMLRAVLESLAIVLAVVVLWRLSRVEWPSPHWGWRRFLATVIGGGLVLQVGWLVAFRAEPFGDARFYHDSAQWFTEHCGFTDEEGNPICWRPPGYTAFLAALYWAFGPDTRVGIAANLICYVVIIALIGVAGRTFCNERCGRAAAVVAAIMPCNLAATGLILTENLATVGLLGSAILFAHALRGRVRWRLVVLAGLLLGVTAYVRPNVLPLVGGVCVTLFVRRRPWIQTIGVTALVSVIVAATVYPWILRNERQFGLWAFCTNSATLLYSSYHERTDRWALEREFLADHPDMCDHYRQGQASARRFIREHPGLAIRNVLLHFRSLTASNDELVNNSIGRSPKISYPPWVNRLMQALSNAAYFACVLAMLIGVWNHRLFDRYVHLSVFGATFILFLWSMSLLGAQIRYHFVVLPFMILCAVPWMSGALRLGPHAHQGRVQAP